MRKTNETKLPKNLKEIKELDNSDFKKAIDLYIAECNSKIKKLQNENFILFDELSALNMSRTALKTQVLDGENFLKEKDSENPRVLRDSIKDKEEMKSQIIIENQIASEKIKELEEEIVNIKEKIKQNDINSKKLSKRIETALDVYTKRKEENK